MAAVTLEQLRHLIDQLDPADQARLLEYLAPRVARTAAAPPPDAAPDKANCLDAWSAFFRIGDAIAALETPQSESLTAAVTHMRR